MKKILLGTSALALAGAFASPAASAEWEMRVGGYMEQFVGFATSDLKGDFTFPGGGANPNGDYDGIDSKQDAEIWFIPSITLDNGIKIGANIQLEAFQNGDQIDESYMFIKGSFGEILLGSENSAGYKMTYAAPDVTFINVNSGSLTSFIPFSGAETGADIFRGTLGSSYLENGRNNDAQRFTYFSPRFAGLQIGLSYARDGLQDTNAQVDVDSTLSDIFDVGANYVNSFGDFNVAISGRWGIADAPSGFDNPTLWVAGLNLGMAGFTLGGSYGEQNGAGLMNGEVYDLGVSYETGRWGFSFTYFRGENVNNECFFGGFDACTAFGASNDEVLKQYLVGISYDLAKGVNLGAYGAFVDFDEECRDDLGDFCEGVEGWVVGSGIKIKF